MVPGIHLTSSCFLRWVLRGRGLEYQEGDQLAHVLADPCSSPGCQAACLCFACCCREGSEGKGPSIECSGADPPRRATSSLAVQLRSGWRWACRWLVLCGMCFRDILQEWLLMAAVKTHGHSSLIIHSGPLLQCGKTMLKKYRGAPKVKKTLLLVFCFI